MAKKNDAAPAQRGRDLRALGKTWLDRIEAAGKSEKQWMDDADIAVCAYTGEAGKTETSDAGRGIAYDFNILFSNVETIVPAIINSPPAPDIRRRFAADDPVARDLAEIMERAIRIQVDDSRLQIEMEAMAQDVELAGRGVIRLRFRSDISKGEPGDDELRQLANADRPGAEEDEPDGAQEKVENERITFEAVSWRDYRHGPAKRWEDRPWDAFRHSMPLEDCDDFADAEVLACQKDETDSTLEANSDHVVWEVWDKKKRRVIFIRATDMKVLKIIDDPLGLTQFFPIATPVQAIEVTGRLMPVNPFAIYRRLADELDTTTKRIRVITKQLKIKGWYAVSPTDVQAVLEADDNEFVPIADAEIWAANGGLQAAVLFWPVEKLIGVLAELYKLREQTKQAIYEITGISDIVRGASKATETLGAQQIKSQWGSLRIQKKQRGMERAARDLFVMMSEIIPTRFAPETLEKLTGVQIVPTPEDLTPTPRPNFETPPPPEVQQQAMQEWQQSEEARGQKLQHLMQLQALMHEKLATTYRIDVETDSTVQADVTRQKKELTEFMGAATSYFSAVLPLVKEGTLPMEVAAEIFASAARMFNLGKSAEDAVEKMIGMAKERAAQPQPPDPARAQQEAEAQRRHAEDERRAQFEQAERDRKTEESRAKLAIDQQKARDESQQSQVDLRIKLTDLRIRETDLAIRETELMARRATGLFGPATQLPATNLPGTAING